jgi:hypothetical protein
MTPDFKELCTPAKLYFFLAVLACVIALFNRVAFSAVLVKLVFAFIWTYILSWLCKKGWKSLAWFLVLLPYILILLVLLRIVRM